MVVCPQCKTENVPDTLKCGCGYQFRPVGDRSPLPLTPDAVDREALNTGFFSFRTFISPLLIKLIYILGVIGIVAASIAVALMPADRILPDVPFSPKVKSISLSVIILIVGNLLWRMICELWMVLFSVRAALILVARRLRRQR